MEHLRLDKMDSGQIKKIYPEFGEPIPGSRYVRGYCPRCHAPMRMEHGTPPRCLPWCDDCGRLRPLDGLTEHLVPRQRARLGGHLS